MVTLTVTRLPPQPACLFQAALSLRNPTPYTHQLFSPWLLTRNCGAHSDFPLSCLVFLTDPELPAALLRGEIFLWPWQQTPTIPADPWPALQRVGARQVPFCESFIPVYCLRCINITVAYQRPQSAKSFLKEHFTDLVIHRTHLWKYHLENSWN